MPGRRKIVESVALLFLTVWMAKLPLQKNYYSRALNGMTEYVKWYKNLGWVCPNWNLQPVCQKEESPSSIEDRTYLAKCLVLPNTFWQGLIESPWHTFGRVRKLLWSTCLTTRVFPSMSNWRCCLDNGEGVVYKGTTRQVRSIIDVRLKRSGWDWSQCPARAIFQTKW